MSRTTTKDQKAECHTLRFTQKEWNALVAMALKKNLHPARFLAWKLKLGYLSEWSQ